MEQLRRSFDLHLISFPLHQLSRLFPYNCVCCNSRFCFTLRTASGSLTTTLQFSLSGFQFCLFARGVFTRDCCFDHQAHELYELLWQTRLRRTERSEFVELSHSLRVSVKAQNSVKLLFDKQNLSSCSNWR